MRSIWLASAAIILSAGFAAAQSTTSPAPTGAPNAPTEAPAGSSASPGNTGTGNNNAGITMAPGASSSNAVSSSGMGAPAPTGAPQAAQESNNPNASPGNMAPGGSNPSTSNTAMAPASSSSTTASSKPVHHGMGGMSVPENASADRYLHIASDAIKHHNKGVADDALSHAETRLLTRAVPASANTAPDDSPRVSAIEGARKALSSGDYQTAADDTRQAMPDHMGGMGHVNGDMGGGSGGMSNPTTTSGTPMPGTPMSNDAASGTSAGSGK